jgi:hypothetical protein
MKLMERKKERKKKIHGPVLAKHVGVDDPEKDPEPHLVHAALAPGRVGGVLGRADARGRREGLGRKGLRHCKGLLGKVLDCTQPRAAACGFNRLKYVESSK